MSATTPLPRTTVEDTANPEPGTMIFAHIEGLVGLFIWLCQLIFAPWKGPNGVRPKRYAYWTHVGVYVGDDLVLEAMPGGARIATNNYLPVAWSTRAVDPAIKARMVELAPTYKRKPYGFLVYVAIFAEKNGFGWAPWVQNKVQERDEFICSQMADDLETKAGGKVFDDGRLAQSVMPCELAALGIKVVGLKRRFLSSGV